MYHEFAAGGHIPNKTADRYKRRRQQATIGETAKQIAESHSAEQTGAPPCSRTHSRIHQIRKMVMTMQLNNVSTATAAKLLGHSKKIDSKIKSEQLGLVEDLIVVFEDCWSDFKERALRAVRAKKMRLIGAVEEHAFDEQSFDQGRIRPSGLGEDASGHRGQ